VKVFDNVAGVERDVVTWSESKAHGVRRYFTGKACVYGHVTERQVSSRNCYECIRLNNRRTPLGRHWRNVPTPPGATAFDNVHNVERKVIAPFEARALSLPSFFTGKPCMNGHVTQRQTLNRSCRECDRLKGRKENMSFDAWERKNAKQRVENMSPEQVEKYRLTRAICQSAREASKLNATPTWADKAGIAFQYSLSDRLTRESGVAHHVDHIVALRCKEASGLHVPANLRVIPGCENESKHAKLDHALAIDPNPPQCTLASCRCGARAALFTPLLAA
jgi:hypothetical protein